jgi:predicted ATP-grasp superfamily ATP-dependent carboligase
MRALLATTCAPEDRKTLCAARSLAGRGVAVTVGSDAFSGLAYHSRAVSRTLQYPHPKGGAREFVAALRDQLERCPQDAVIPTSGYTTYALSEYAAGLEGVARTAVPEPASIAESQDKYRLWEICRELGIEVPNTLAASSAPGLAAAMEKIGYPCVVKMRRGSGASGLRIFRAPVRQVAWLDDRRAPDLVYDYGQFVVQEQVPGVVHDVCALFCHGELRAALTQRRSRTYPAAAGIGVDCITTDEPHLVERAAALMKRLRWHGPAQIEFITDESSGRVWLIEVNGRFWGGLALSVWAGVDFPWLTYRMAVDGDVPRQSGYRIGARYRWPFFLGLLHVKQSARRLAALKDMFGPSPDTGGDWRWSDPLPHVAEACYAVRRMWSRGSIRPQERSPVQDGPA